jgi:uncharacterized membrane protein HdeD (DUF308 family)
MNETVSSVMTGAVAMASLVAALFFLRFWRQTRYNLFLLFAIAFAIDGLSRFALGLAQRSDETEAFFYVPRLITFVLIILAIALKNRPRKPS